jgi:hypothetical protein
MPRQPRPANVFERRANMLSDAMQHRVNTMAAAIRPKGARPPFTRRMTAQEALDWWLAHRYDPHGLALVAAMQPPQVAALDAWLAQATQHLPPCLRRTRQQVRAS